MWGQLGEWVGTGKLKVVHVDGTQWELTDKKSYKEQTAICGLWRPSLPPSEARLGSSEGQTARAPTQPSTAGQRWLTPRPTPLRADTQWPLVFSAQAPLWEQFPALCSTGARPQGGGNNPSSRSPAQAKGPSQGLRASWKSPTQPPPAGDGPRPSLPSWLQPDRCVPPSPSSRERTDITEHRDQKELSRPLKPQLPVPSLQLGKLSLWRLCSAQSAVCGDCVICRTRVNESTKAEGPDWQEGGLRVRGGVLFPGHHSLQAREPMELPGNES